MQVEDTKPWYRQFWPWFLIAIPTSSLIVGSQVLRLALDGTNAMVVDDYYKEGKTINARLDKIETAIQKNISTSLLVNGANVALTFLSGAPETKQALKLDFYHATIASKDFYILLSSDANGVFRGQAPTTIEGKWRIRLTPLDESWKVQKQVFFPQNNAIEFSPNL